MGHRKQRTQRRRLKAHDQGQERHNKGVRLLQKQTRLEQEHGNSTHIRITLKPRKPKEDTHDC